MSAYGEIVRTPTGLGPVILQPTVWKHQPVIDDLDPGTGPTTTPSVPESVVSDVVDSSVLTVPVPVSEAPTTSPRYTSKGTNPIVMFHLTLASASVHEGLVDYLSDIFAKEVEKGMTYPQEGPMDREGFEKYFFAGDVFVGLVYSDSDARTEDGKAIDVSLEQIKGTRGWQESIAGFYYVKPNYPGRSSHICNGGFVVPPRQRGQGYGRLLGRSYLHYAPRLGYQGSVFNLVYVNNTASVRLWERLGFVKAGRIPMAGRLARRDGKGQEVVDAWVFYCRLSVPNMEGI